MQKRRIIKDIYLKGYLKFEKKEEFELEKRESILVNIRKSLSDLEFSKLLQLAPFRENIWRMK